ncbi:hypothetical protein JCM10908_005600 [Rhodotorula pacifica]|uniref:uncharacterized protein n=1 Tax=Rhodotorula pacifica TaxID=1495444 RepID=UPI003172E4F7
MARDTLSIAGIAAHTAPKGLTGFLKWLYHRRKNRKHGLPAKELTYAEGVDIVKAFLHYAATHGVGELQRFTASKVPSASWVIKETIPVSQVSINEAAHLLRKALAADSRTVELVGGNAWWTLRGRELTGEWIEMKKDRQKRGTKPPDRVLFYLHGGAHFFSSLETHRYQIVRHARKLGARAFAPSQRLAPQYPFPCALHDALASYLFLIDPPKDGTATHEPIPPEKIIMSGDSAGGGLALSLLMVLRDLDLPMPAGATLISPWVDLAHSFPSVGGDGKGDYIPANGFIYRPDLVWPPPPDARNAIEQILVGEEEMVEDGMDIKIRLEEQVQMYCHNQLLNHPLVSPVNAGSLGGLPPLYICCGGSELLQDEIIYIAHKAANPKSYPPAPRILEDYPSQKAQLETHYPPTKVQLQVFDGGCHVATTLSVTSLAKYMFRGAANAGLYFLAEAATRESTPSRVPRTRTSTDSARVRPATVNDPISWETTPHSAALDLPLLDDLDSEGSQPGTISTVSTLPPGRPAENDTPARVTATGHLPAFSHSSPTKRGSAHMIRQRVSLQGTIRPLEPPEDLPGCNMRPEDIGRLHAIPVRKWLKQRQTWDERYAKDLARWREVKVADRAKAEQGAFLLGQFPGERPPLGSIAGWHDRDLARKAASSVDEAVGKKTAASLPLAMWANISGKPDEAVVGEEEKTVDKVADELGRKVSLAGGERSRSGSHAASAPVA